MKYKTWLKNKNLSDNTIKVYLNNYEQWKKFINNKEPNKTRFIKFINSYANTHSPRSIRLMHASLLQLFKFEKRWKLISECKDIKLPTVQSNIRTTITFKEFNSYYLKRINDLTPWIEKRNWLICLILLNTGIRVSELLQFNKEYVFEGNKFKIRGKGNKYRIIFLNKIVLEELEQWNYNYITIKKNNKPLGYREINRIVSRLFEDNFNKKLLPHDLRRSYATNLMKNNVNIEITRKVLGHSNINTTSSYMQFTDEDIIRELNKVKY